MVTAGLEAMMNRQYNNQGKKWTALYVRLSRDDENEGDSNSIQHQIEILTKYCKDHDISRYQIYKDDGFSGTNFKRPGFLDMIGDIEAGLVNMVIVKDECVILELNTGSPQRCGPHLIPRTVKLPKIPIWRNIKNSLNLFYNKITKKEREIVKKTYKISFQSILS